MAKKEICRLCLVETISHISLLEEKNAEMLFALTSIKVISDDAISNIACLKCHLNLKLAYKIQQDMIKADERFLKTKANKQKSFQIKLEEPNNESVVLCANQCFICGDFVSDHLLLKSHMEEHFQQKQKCDICNLPFHDLKSYETHNLINHNHTNNIYQCKKCKFNFRYKVLYVTHMEKLHQKLGEFNCDQCSQTFPTRQKYKSHLIKHEEKKTCPFCQKEIKSNSYYIHVRDHKEGAQMCEVCGITMKSVSCLRMHIRYSHSSVLYKCNVCDKSFKKKPARDEHVLKLHEDPSFVCDECGKKFYTSHRLSVHKKSTHLKLRPYKCEYCKKNFSSSYALKTHKRQHTNETPYKCNVCGEGFRQRVSLKAHQRSKHGIEELKTCKCKECGKAFASEWALQTHQRVH